MSDRTLRHLIAQHLTDFLEDWYGQQANASRQPIEHDFAAWLGRHAFRGLAKSPA